MLINLWMSYLEILIIIFAFLFLIYKKNNWKLNLANVSILLALFIFIYRAGIHPSVATFLVVLFLFFISIYERIPQIFFTISIPIVTSQAIINFTPKLDFWIFDDSMQENIRILLIISGIFVIIFLISFFARKLIDKYPNSRVLASIGCIGFLIGACIYVRDLIEYFHLYAKFFNTQGTFFVEILFTIILSLALVLVIAFYAYKRNQELLSENKRKDIENEISTIYVEQIQRQYQDVRNFKHDYLNILLSMELYMDEGNMDNLKEYFYKEIAPTKKIADINRIGFQNLNNIQSMEIRAIFINKLRNANDKIKIHIDIPENIIPQNINNSVNLVRIIGIILDNALEELCSLAEKDKPGQLNIAIFPLEKRAVIVIENSMTEERKDILHINEKGISSKGENRGLGLYNIQGIVKSSSHIDLTTSSENYKFRQKLSVKGGTING